MTHRIRRIAHESAVDPSSFTEQSASATASTLSVARVAPVAAGPSRVLRAEGNVPPCFVAEIPRDSRDPRDPLDSPTEYLTTPQSTQPSRSTHHPRQGAMTKHIPLNPAYATEPSLQDQSQTQQRQRRRRRRRLRENQYDRPAPRFFAPPVGLGGKSRGYAWGWRDSFEGRREDRWEGYLRS
jgi:hypothetical protein